tara:strand:+ start:2028 stop:2204 length:177 start_codon:yes stop_codon:yes gene_type:complete
MKQPPRLLSVIAYDTAPEEKLVSLRSCGRKVSTQILHIESSMIFSRMRGLMTYHSHGK